MESYDPNAWYKYTDQNGNTFTIKGDDPLAKESITLGLPISVTESGERYIYPFVEQDGDGVVAHIPSWFKESEEYLEWEYVWAPTIPNTEINPYTISVMNKTLDRLGKEAATKRSSSTSNLTKVETTGTVQETRQQVEDSLSITDYTGIIIPVLIMLISAIAIAVWFAQSVKNKIKQREEFSGMGWGIINGITGLGILSVLFVVIAHSSINDEINQVKNKKYKKYVRRQMNDFTRAYVICLLIWVTISIVSTIIAYSQ